MKKNEINCGFPGTPNSDIERSLLRPFYLANKNELTKYFWSTQKIMLHRLEVEIEENASYKAFFAMS